MRLPSAIDHVMSKKKIEILNRKLEIAQKHIQDSINYAKSIQNSMLADTKLLSDEYPESFIIFKPKDTLSGDFYWFRKEEHIFFVAAADCTGHGIPGALMSMIGMEKLNNIVLTTKEPAEILRKLNKSLEAALRQSTQFEHSQDGMDIALCCINKETGIMKYSGANRPLWIIRGGKNAIEEIEATHEAIGGITTTGFPVFKTHEIILQSGDTFFIFSDGYTDQFGGKFDKKLTIRRFRELLITIQAQTMAQQEITIRNYIEDWKADHEQIDDILVIGIRING